MHTCKHSNLQRRINLWKSHTVEYPELQSDLQKLEQHPEQLLEAFGSELSFGTSGLRGIMGIGPNRLNIYTVAQIAQGIASFIVSIVPQEKRKLAIGYDSRNNSRTFAHTAACVFAANGIEVAIYPDLAPTPMLSWAIRDLGCSGGIMITASHNRREYNGIKVYGPDGGQLTTSASEKILAKIRDTNIFSDIKTTDFSDAQSSERIRFIEQTTYDRYVERVKAESLLSGVAINKDFTIVYTPLNGTGLKPMLRVLSESGYTDVRVVPEQRNPDGNFPTCPYPNPEMSEAMELGIAYAKSCKAKLVIATDPDADRASCAIADKTGELVHLSSNETGMLLLDYICSRKTQLGTMPPSPVFIKTIVSTALAQRIADKHGVRTINVLTGFKHIGEQISQLEYAGQSDSYIFGFEESCSYLSGSYIRDKDGIDACLLICEMHAWYAKQKKTLLDRLQELYEEFGHHHCSLHNFQFPGTNGIQSMRAIMHRLRNVTTHIGAYRVEQIIDYSQGIDGLPPSDVLRIILSDRISIMIRPSGTEPKLKLYIAVTAQTDTECRTIKAQVLHDCTKLFKSSLA